MSKFKVVAFCGSKMAGKDTSCDFMKQNYTGETKSLALAGTIKSVCSDVFHLDRSFFHNQALKELPLKTAVTMTENDLIKIFAGFGVDCEDSIRNNPEFITTYVNPHIGVKCETPRYLLQYVGTEILRPVDDLIHAKSVYRVLDPEAINIITDMRFLNEFEYFAKNDNVDFVPFYIQNESAEEAAAGDTHASERDLVKFKGECVKIDNNASLEVLRNTVVTKMKEFDIFN